MKAVRKLVMLVSLGVIGVVVASATPLEQTYIDSCRKDPGVPVPFKVVTPAVSTDYAGQTVELEFTVNPEGAPVNLSVTSQTDAPLADAVVEAVKQWKFKPAMRDGAPVATKVELPVKIVEPAEPPMFAVAN